MTCVGLVQYSLSNRKVVYLLGECLCYTNSKLVISYSDSTTIAIPGKAGSLTLLQLMKE